MAKILLINPNKWGRGITHIWIASHSGILKRNNHKVELFDATFYSNWSLNEVQFQTDNKMYKKTNYDEFLKFNSNNILEDLQKKIYEFNPDFIFWSANYNLAKAGLVAKLSIATFLKNSNKKINRHHL